MKKLGVLLLVLAGMATISCSDDFQEFDNEQMIENVKSEGGDGEHDPCKGDCSTIGG